MPKHGRTRVLVDTTAVAFKLPLIHYDAVVKVAQVQDVNYSTVLRAHVHVALTARGPLARAVAALWAAEAEADAQVPGGMHIGWRAPDPVVEDLLALYADIVLGQSQQALRLTEPPPGSPEAWLVAQADAKERATRRTLIEAALRTDLGLPPQTPEEAFDAFVDAVVSAESTDDLP